MSIWKSPISVEEANGFSLNTLAATLDIHFTEVGEDYVVATMPVDHRNHQPMGILHGGASVALAETVGSFAAQMAAEPGYGCVGLDINANHLRSVREGLVTAIAKPIHIGRSTQVWEINIFDAADRKVCASRLTMAVLKI
ncbi:hotdog fold thioesterase [Oceanicoccus sp. KOV_DT_Chl]|uniref:hotdog fold thioesterase n=1 Tax=Oceanicoccus sp. KOV_DT_Chl TaxID=1904639 RepID=UPI000C7BE011|nr:hotdog fold thioesterase [Oceanicoccus sp. KOV_DT_Chl]